MQKYGESLAIGTVIGTISGAATRLMDEIVPAPLNWCFWYDFRWQTIYSCARKDIELDKNLIADSAWASAWISYFMVYCSRGTNSRKVWNQFCALIL